MFYIRWTGLGCLSPALTIAILFVGVYVGVTLTGDDGIPAGILVGAGLTVLLAPLHWLLGLILNAERMPSGLRWHNDHTCFDMPVQYGFVPQLVFALILGSIALGQLTSPLYGWLLFGGVPAVALVGYGLLDKERHLGPVSNWVVLYALVVLILGSIVLGHLASPLYGWLLFGGVPVVALVGYLMIDSRRQLRSVAGRKEFAAERGWLYKDRISNLGLRWQDVFGKKAAYRMSPFGVLAGEVEGLPFTSFDSETGGSKTRRTYWVIHLPVAYPRVQVQRSLPDNLRDAFGKPTTPDDLYAKTADAAFGQALLTPQVRSATVTLGLVGWQIEGRDLILERSPDKPHTANEVAQVATHLADLARQLPADLADHFGTPPSTDVPLRLAESEQELETRPHFSRARNRRRIGIVALCLVLLLSLPILHINLPASAATVTVRRMSQTLKQDYNLTVNRQTDLAHQQIRGLVLSYTTPTETKTVTVQNIVHIAAVAAHGNVVFSQLTGSINLRDVYLTINLGNGFSLSLDNHTTDMQPGGTYTEPITVDQAGSQGNLPADTVDGTYSGLFGLPPNTTAYLSNPQPFTGGSDSYDGPVVAPTDIDQATSDLATQAYQQAQRYFQTHIPPGEVLFDDLACTQTSMAQPPIDTRAATVKVSAYSTCQIEAYDQQGAVAAFLSAAQQLAASKFDSHFALVHPLNITITNPGKLSPSEPISISVQSEWHLLLDKRGKQAVQQALAGLSQDDAKALLLKRYDTVTTNLSLSWWWGGHLPIDPNAIQIVDPHPST